MDKKTRAKLRDHCEKLQEDDCVDPRDYFKKQSGRKNDHKLRRLCRQVGETLGLVLSGECDDDLLRSLAVLSVTPWPDAGQLMVILEADLQREQFDAAKVENRLKNVAGKLRSEIAAAITRKRTPNLLFQVIGPAETPAVNPEEK